MLLERNMTAIFIFRRLVIHPIISNDVWRLSRVIQFWRQISHLSLFNKTSISSLRWPRARVLFLWTKGRPSGLWPKSRRCRASWRAPFAGRFEVFYPWLVGRGKLGDLEASVQCLMRTYGLVSSSTCWTESRLDASNGLMTVVAFFFPLDIYAALADLVNFHAEPN